MEYLEKWEKYLYKNNKSKNTISTYTTAVSQFLEFLKDKDISKINGDDFRAFKSLLAKKGLCINTINNRCIAVNAYIDYLNNIIDEDINYKAIINKVQVQDFVENAFEKDELQKLIDCAKSNDDYRTYAVLNALRYTGVRISELLQFKVTDIWGDSKVVRGKGEKYRVILIPEKLRKILTTYVKKYRKEIKDCDALFTSQKGELTRYTIDRDIKKYAKLCNIDKSKAHAHNLRHYFCSSLVEMGVSLDQIANLAGHENINTTRIYTRKNKSDLLDTVNAL